ncbi:MAG: hypothetical protein QOG50_2899 [Actinomycetota bacterium]|nr:hypothetical protein [Actinomycetota bacterium]
MPAIQLTDDDESRVEEFAGSLFGACLATMELANVELGVRLGLYEALAGAGPIPPRSSPRTGFPRCLWSSTSWIPANESASPRSDAVKVSRRFSAYGPLTRSGGGAVRSGAATCGQGTVVGIPTSGKGGAMIAVSMAFTMESLVIPTLVSGEG